MENHNLQHAMQEYNRLRRTHDMLRHEHREVIKQLDQAREDMDEAKADLTQMLAEEYVRTGRQKFRDHDFRYTLVVRDTGSYDLNELPPTVRAIPGVIRREVDKRAIEHAIEEGRITRADVDAAWRPKHSEPSIRVTVARG